MSDWEADDFDCTAQVTDKLVALGLDTALKKDQKEESAPTNDTTGDLTEQQKVALQKQSDVDIGLELLGITPEKGENLERLTKQTDFGEYAEDLAASITAMSSHNHYLFFVNSFVGRICKPMSRFQLETIRQTIDDYIKQINKKEEEQKKKLTEGKQQVKTKKAKKVQLYEDTVEDEYDDFDEKYNF